MAFTVQFRQTKDALGSVGWTYVIVEDDGYRYPGSDDRFFASKKAAEVHSGNEVARLQRIREGISLRRDHFAGSH